MKNSEKRSIKLFESIKSGNIEKLKTALTRVTDLNVTDNEGNTTLNCVCFWDRIEAVRLLLKCGADPNARNRDGYAALHSALDHKSKTAGDIVKLLIDHGADVNQKVNAQPDENGYTPLHYACGNSRNVKAVRLLIESGADVNAIAENGYTPLSKTCENGELKMAEMLIDAGADVNYCNDWGETFLRVATYNGHSEIVRLLLKKGIDVNAKDKWGRTPLHWACNENKPNAEIAGILLDHGAGIDAIDEGGKTPLEYAISIPDSNQHREPLIDLFRRYAPEMVMEKFCTGGPGGWV